MTTRNGEQTGTGPERESPEAPSMPTAHCPFCLEVINDRARRCRHCGSDLEEPVSPRIESGKVVYVVDRDLIRFTKVSLSLLGLFAVAGLYLLGIDLKRTVSDIDLLRREVEADSKTINDQATRIENAERVIQSSQEEIRMMAANVASFRAAAQSDASSARSALQIILETQGKVLVVAEALSFGQDGTTSIRTQIAAANPDANSGRGYKLWDAGTALSVRFIGGSSAEHDAVKEAARIWTEHANIEFVFDDSPSAMIRIAFEVGDGSWSYVGTDNLILVGQDQPTMNFGSSVLDDQDTILHQFGHSLGLKHEHQNPFGGLEWNEDAVYEQWASAPYFWDRATVHRNIILKNPSDQYAFPKPFDPNSIMMYPFGAGLLEQPFEYGITPQPGLSSTDIEYIAKLYPQAP